MGEPITAATTGAGDHVSVGASGSTVISSVADVVELRLPSASLAVAAMLKVKLTSVVGVTVKLDSVQLLTSTEVLPVAAVNEWVPSLSVAPSGIALTTSD